MSASSAATSTGCSARWRRPRTPRTPRRAARTTASAGSTTRSATHLSRSLEEMRSFYAGRARELVDVLLARFDLHNVIAVLRAHAGAHAPGRGGAPDADRHGLAGRSARARDPAPGRARRRRRPARPLHAGPRAGRRAARRLRRVRAHGGSRGARARRRRRPRGARGRRAVGRGPERQDAAAVHAARDRRAQPPDRAAPARRAGARRRGRGHAARRRVDPARALRGGPPRCRAGRRRGGARPARRAGPGRRRCNSGRRAATCSGSSASCSDGRIEAAAALFVAGDPLSIDVPIAFAAAKRSEARNLRLLGEASARGIHPDTVRRELLARGAR